MKNILIFLSILKIMFILTNISNLVIIKKINDKQSLVISLNTEYHNKRISFHQLFSKKTNRKIKRETGIENKAGSEDASQKDATDSGASAPLPIENTGSPNEVKIRNFGTFYIEVIDTSTEYVPPAKKTEAASADAAQKTDSTAKDQSKKFFSQRRIKVEGGDGQNQEQKGSNVPEKTGRQQALETASNIRLFGGPDKLELPIICGVKLTEEEMISLASKGQEYLNAWKSAAGDQAALFNSLPDLNAQQFASFYAAYTKNSTILTGFVKPEEANKNPEKLVKAANFENAGLTTVGWLQFWVYQCNSGIKPEDKEYLSETPRNDQEFEDKLKAKLGFKAMSITAGKKRRHKLKRKMRKRKAIRRFK